MAKGVKLVRPNKDVRKGVALILHQLHLDYESDFERIFGELTSQQFVEVTAAIEWMEQYAPDDWTE